MTATAPAETAPTPSKTFLANEPWGIWAGVLAFILALLVSVLSFGVAGLVVVMAPAALGMVALLSLIVFG